MEKEIENIIDINAHEEASINDLINEVMEKVPGDKSLNIEYTKNFVGKLFSEGKVGFYKYSENGDFIEISYEDALESKILSFIYIK